MSVELLEVPSRDGLDSIRVYWHNIAPGKGYVTITCYGDSWNTYFNAMSGDTIQEFFQRVGTDYMVNALIHRKWFKKDKNHEKYLTRIVDAIKAEMKGVAV